MESDDAETGQGQNAVSQDLEHIRLLSIFHYVVAGLASLFAMFPIIHLVVGLALLAGVIDDETGDPAARLVGGFFVALAGVWIVFGLTFAACLIAAGRSLSRHRNYQFCLVMAGIACVFMPFGTVLGVFTIVVLMRESVKRLFGRTAALP